MRVAVPVSAAVALTTCAALLGACSHERAAPIARAEPSTTPSSAQSAVTITAPDAAGAATTTPSADAGAPVEPKSTALRCGDHPLEVGRTWIEIIEESEKPHGAQVGCYLFGTAEASKSSTRLEKKILAMSAGRVTKLRIKYIVDSNPPDQSLQDLTATIDLTTDPPTVDGVDRKFERRLREEAKSSFATWPKSDDPSALEKAFLAWRHTDPAGEMRKVKTKASKAKLIVPFPSARGFSFVNDVEEESAGMCHGGESSQHLTGTMAVVDDAFVAFASLTITEKAWEGTCQGCGPNGERACPHARCKDTVHSWVLRVPCDP
jgi:hypothetical protein